MLVLSFFICFFCAYIITKLIYKTNYDEAKHGSVQLIIGIISGAAFYTIYNAAKVGNATEKEAIIGGSIWAALIMIVAFIFLWWKKYKDTAEISKQEGAGIKDIDGNASNANNIFHVKTNGLSSDSNANRSKQNISSIKSPNRKLRTASLIVLFLLIVVVIAWFTYWNKENIKTINTAIPLKLPPVSSDMARVTIPEIGTIDIADNMEVQNEAWRQSVESYKKDMGIQPSSNANIVIKQKGLDKYCRIIVETIMGKPGDYTKLTENYTATQEELSYYSKTVKNGIEEGFKSNADMKLLEWYLPRLETINGMTAAVNSYKRQLGENPPVLVWQYMFQNYDRLIILTLSYRENETEIWKPLFSQSLNSFRITNITSNENRGEPISTEQ